MRSCTDAIMRCLAFLPLLVACSAQPSSQAAPDVPLPSLFGQWRIVTLDGRAAVAGHDGQPPVLTFSELGYSGYVGCNAFGGQGLAHEDRFYGGFAVSTAMACGAPFDGQETGVQQLLASGPRIEWLGPDRLVIAATARRLELARTGPLPVDRFVVAPTSLIGSVWSFGALDGRAIEMPDAPSRPTLTVEGDRFTLETPCLTTEGGWTQTGVGTVSFSPERRAMRACNPASRRQSEAWAEAMRGALRYGNGPNAEILLAGGGHWMVGDRVRRGSSEATSLAGRYEVEGGPSRAQRNGARPAELILATNAYYLWDGCNRSEGLAIAFERQLFLHGSGLSTLANCAPGRDDARFKEIVLSEPRIGRTPGGLLLSSPVGTIRLRRTGDAAPGTRGVSTRLMPGMHFTLLAEGGSTLAILPGNRFRLTQPCGVTEGRWRAAPREVDGAMRFGPEPAPAACERDATARAVLRHFLGNVDLVIGPNRDIALFAGQFGAVSARLER